VREALASVSQPLISDPSARPRWVNIHSRDDVISGPLDYYDLPASAPPPQARLPTGHPTPIDNLEDPHAWIPLLGHEQYLSNELLLGTLANTITGRPSPVPPLRPD
jgi:hypothetical protein